MRKTAISFIIIVSIISHSIAQLSFIKSNNVYRKNIKHNSGMATGFIDINNDLLDDVITLHKSTQLQIGLNTGNENPLEWTNEVRIASSPEYSMIAGDFNNDGLVELVSGGVYSNTKVYKLNDKKINLIQKITEPIYTQASNAVDINNDGYLDYFACHDEGQNLILINDKNGKLIPQNLIDFSTDPPSDASGSYGSEWCDVDNDGDLDLYIAKCKFGVTDREDPRRHNMLFINYNGSFVNEALQRGLKDKGQSWTGSFADIDNDGDMDCLVTNHDEEHHFYINDGKGNFTLNKALDIPKSFAFQSLFADFDNNGFIDLLLTGADDAYFLLNKGNYTFEKLKDGIDFGILNSAALGDINDDGFIDVNGVYGTNINYPSPRTDQLYVNQGNQNNFIKISLKGIQSNLMGIGAKLLLYGNWGIQKREVHSGVSYGISNSTTQIFGLGSNTKIDSLVILWPSGVKDKYSNLNPKTHYIATEGKCLTTKFNLFTSKNFLCPNESIEIVAAKSFTKYKWNTNSTNPSIFVSSPGIYNLVGTEADGCIHYSNLITIEETSRESLLEKDSDILYFCDTIIINSNKNLIQPIWNNTINSPHYIGTKTELVLLKAKNQCGVELIDTINLIKVTDTKFIGDTVPIGGTAVLKGDKNTKWYDSNNNLIHTGDKLTISNLQRTTKYYAQSTNTTNIQKYSIGEKTFEQDKYPANNNDIGMYIDVYAPINIESFTTFSDLAGTRRFLIINAAGDTVARKDVFIPENKITKVDLDFNIEPGINYILTTDKDFNKSNFDFVAPRLVSTLSPNLTYPYEIKDLIDIPYSYRGGLGYYYFYDIKVNDRGITCNTPLTEVIAYLDKDVKTKEENHREKLIYPNPVNDKLNIKFNQLGDYKIYSITGVKLMEGTINSEIFELDVTSLNNGIYLFLFIDESGKQSQSKFIKQ